MKCYEYKSKDQLLELTDKRDLSTNQSLLDQVNSIGLKYKGYFIFPDSS